MLPIRSVLFLLAFIGLSASSILVPILGVANYMMIYQIFPEHAWWGIPLEPLGLRYSMTAAVCLMFGMVLNVHRLPAVRPVLSVWDMAAILMVIVVITSEFIGALPTSTSAYLTGKFVKMMIFIFCLTRIITTRRNYTIVLWTLVLGSLYIGYDAYTAPRGAFTRGRLEVVGGPDFRHSSGLATHMASMLPLIAMAVITSRSWIPRGVALLSAALTVNTVVLCRTRSAFVGLFAGVVAAILFAPRGRRILVIVLLTAGILCAYALMDQPFLDRMATLLDREALRDDPAATGRTSVWRGAKELIIQYPLGIGIGNFTQMIDTVDRELRLRAAHNTFVLCWTELGTQGMIVFLIILGTSFLQVRYCFRNAEATDEPRWTRYMAFGLMLAMLISLGAQFFTERLYTEAFWWILALPGCLQRVVIAEAEQRSVRLESNQLVHGGHWPEPVPALSRRTTGGAFA